MLHNFIGRLKKQKPIQKVAVNQKITEEKMYIPHYKRTIEPNHEQLEMARKLPIEPKTLVLVPKFCSRQMKKQPNHIFPDNLLFFFFSSLSVFITFSL